MKFAAGSGILDSIGTGISSHVTPPTIPRGYVMCSVCHKATPLITSTTGISKPKKSISTIMEPTTFRDKIVHYVDELTLCPGCVLTKGNDGQMIMTVIKFPPRQA